MARFCEKCGTQLEGVEAFCPNCGAPVAAEPETPAAETAAETVAAEQNTAEAAAAPAAPAEECAPEDCAANKDSNDGAPAPAQPQYQQAQPQYTVVTAASAPADQIVSTARFFWFRILFMIPFVGFILSIIMSFAPRNVNFKHFARSYMIMYFISIGLVLIGLIIAIACGAALSDLFRGAPDISYMF